MHLGRRIYHFLIFTILTTLIWGCGQVGFIEGGPVDNAAPQPIMDEMQPPNGSKNCKPEKISIPFNEYIALNSPAQNIRVVPDDVRLEAKIKGKTLILTPKRGEWQDTTTYAIYLKRAVKDITESNDSLMTFVFATGNEIDSLMAAVKVRDAFRNEPVKEITVGLFEQPLIDDTSKVLPRYVAQTDNDGLAQFTYLKKGPFYVYAFKDENKNNVLDPKEKRGTLQGKFYADTAVLVIPELELMPPNVQSFTVKSNEVIPPATWSLSFSKPVSNTADFQIVGDQPVGSIWNETKDSVTYFFGQVGRSGRFRLAYPLKNNLDTAFVMDTIVKKYFFKQPLSYTLTTNLQRGVLLYGDTLSLLLSEAIDFFDTTLFSVRGKQLGDSLYQEIPYFQRKKLPNELQLIFTNKLDSVKMQLSPKALNGFNFIQTDTVLLDFAVQPLSKVGNLEVELDTIPPYSILQLLDKKGDVLQSFVVDNIKSITVEHLQPGDYKFRLLVDENRDGKWTTGDIFTGRRPEKMIWFKDATTIRANWDVKAKLEIAAIFYPKEDHQLEENPDDNESPVMPDDE